MVIGKCLLYIVTLMRKHKKYKSCDYFLLEMDTHTVSIPDIVFGNIPCEVFVVKLERNQLEFVVTFSVVHIPNSLKLSYKTFPIFFPDKAASKSWRQIADFCDL